MSLEMLCSGFNKSYGLTFNPAAIPASVSGLGHSPLSIAPKNGGETPAFSASSS
jgi:hypothetical protein